MKHTMIVLVVLVSLVIGSLSTWADSENPFRFETNTHPLKNDYCKKDKDPKNSGLRGHGYKCSSAPRPHPDFQGYLLIFVEDVGLCAISATSNHFISWQELPEFEMFKDQISQKYGSPTSKTESASEPAYHWSPKAGFNGLGDVKAIDLKADKFKDGFFVLARIHFQLATVDSCRGIIDEKAAHAF